MFDSEAVSPAFKFIMRTIFFVGFWSWGVIVFKDSRREEGAFDLAPRHSLDPCLGLIQV